MNIKDKLNKTKKLLNTIIDTDTKKTVLSMGLGAGSMGVIGSSTGIAILGTAIAGTIPFAITGAVISGLSYKVYSLSKSNKEKKDLK